SDRRHRGSENRRADDEQREIVERTPSDRREMNGPDEPQRRKRQSRRAPLGKEVDQDRRREADERKRRQRVQPDHNTLEHITTYCDAAAPAETAGGRARAARRSPSMNTETLRRRRAGASVPETRPSRRCSRAAPARRRPPARVRSRDRRTPRRGGT